MSVITAAEFLRQMTPEGAEKADWKFCAKVLQQAQDKLEEDGIRHSWMDAAVSIAKSRSIE